MVGHSAVDYHPDDLDNTAAKCGRRAGAKQAHFEKRYIDKPASRGAELERDMVGAGQASFFHRCAI